jgi:hypothetical protein
MRMNGGVAAEVNSRFLLALRAVVGMTAYMNMKRSIGTDYDNAGQRTGIGMVGRIRET